MKFSRFISTGAAGAAARLCKLMLVLAPPGHLPPSPFMLHALSLPSWQKSLLTSLYVVFHSLPRLVAGYNLWKLKTKVLAAEGHKGVPLDPALADLLQGLLKLDSRHRLSARDALASVYFSPRHGLEEEKVSVDDAGVLTFCGRRTSYAVCDCEQHTFRAGSAACLLCHSPSAHVFLNGISTTREKPECWESSIKPPPLCFVCCSSCCSFCTLHMLRGCAVRRVD